jgi:hypothetical protein
MGALIAKSGRAMLFGGGDTGVMGAAARGTHSAGGKVIGVIPEALNLPKIAYPECDEGYLPRKEEIIYANDHDEAMRIAWRTFPEYHEVGAYEMD